jgi:hypothetical protein
MIDGFDVLISDIKPADLPGKVSHWMGVDYLSTLADGNPVWPAKGKLYGENKRVMFTLPVSHENKVVCANFVFDTGALVTYVARSTVTALGIDGCPVVHYAFVGSAFGPVCEETTARVHTSQRYIVNSGIGLG